MKEATRTFRTTLVSQLSIKDPWFTFSSQVVGLRSVRKTRADLAGINVAQGDNV